MTAVDERMADCGEQMGFADAGRTKRQEIVTLSEPAVGFGQRHDVRLGDAGHGREVELFEVLA